jgi:hypothetical protein
MKTRCLPLALLVFIACITLLPNAKAFTAREIMDKHDDARKLDDVFATATLTTGGKTRKEASKTFRWWRKLEPDNIHNNTLIRFSAPAEVRDEAVLLLERADENEVLLYLPTYKKIRRVETQDQSSSFMGSDLSYSDMSPGQINDFNYKLVKEEVCPIKDAKPENCYVVEATPARESVKERTKYSRTLNWIYKDSFMTNQVEAYDLDGKLWKRIQGGDTRMLDTKNKKYFTHVLKVDDLKKNQFTALKFVGVKIHAGTKASVFSKQNLNQTD